MIAIMSKKTVHVVPHSHWDREWYMPFEKHRMKLIQLIDDLLELFETDPDFNGFFLDGQTIVLDDYLEIRPQNREKLIKYIKEGRLSAGPWYILQDEFLVSGESSVRNLLVGMREAEEFGRVSKIGYFPDAFGNAGQMPQLLKQAGMDLVFFGRGVKPIGFNNIVEESGEYESVFSEMKWKSPDGSSLFAVLFANWYCNGMEVPVDEQEARLYWEDRIPKAEKFASTGNLLFLNGCDHQPVQKDLSAALRTARKLFPDTDFKHSSYEEFMSDVLAEQEAKAAEGQGALSSVEGELTSQETDGWWTLVNTCSAHVALKQMNQRNQMALEKLAEPLMAAAHRLGGKYSDDLLRYAWKKLMQNHPHDSICGCSVDEVNREIHTRFEKSLAVSEELASEAASTIADSLDTSAFGEGSLPFVVMNTTGWERTGVVSVELDLDRDYRSGLRPAHRKMEEMDITGWKLTDGTSEVACTIEDLGVHFGYDLPGDRFRQPYMARAVRVTFEAECVPALGVKSFALTRESCAPSSEAGSMVTGDNRMENENLSVAINGDGTLDVTCKATGREYKGMCAYEDTGDIGNEYIFFQPKGTQAITTKGLAAHITMEENSPYRASFRVEHTLRIPKSAAETLRRERETLVDFYSRETQRSEELIDFPIVTYFSLEKHGKGVRIRTEYNNTAEDHRLRILFPTALVTSDHLVDSIFEAVRRPNRPAACWKNPSNCQHQQCFASVSDGKDSVTVANFGLNEYEILPDADNAIAVTLLRCVAEMGDWGVFPTPEAQCLGKGEAQLELIPMAQDLLESRAFAEAYQFQADMSAVQTGVHGGTVKSGNALLEFTGDTLALSAVKEKDANGDLIARWFNLAEKPCELCLKPTIPTSKIYRCNVIEEELEELVPDASGAVRVQVGAAEIVTIGMRGV